MGLERQTSIHLLYEVFVQPLRMSVQSEPHSRTEYVHFEPSPVMVSLGRIKDFHVVRAKIYDCLESIICLFFSAFKDLYGHGFAIDLNNYLVNKCIICFLASRWVSITWSQ